MPPVVSAFDNDEITQQLAGVPSMCFTFEDGPVNILEELKQFASNHQQLLWLERVSSTPANPTAESDTACGTVVIHSSEFRSVVGIPPLSNEESKQLSAILYALQSFQSTRQLMVFSVGTLHCCSCVAMLHTELRAFHKRNPDLTLYEAYRVARFGEDKDFLFTAFSQNVPSFWVHQQVVAIVDQAGKGIALARVSSAAAAAGGAHQQRMEYLVVSAFHDGLLRYRRETSKVDFQALRASMSKKECEALRETQFLVELGNRAIELLRSRDASALPFQVVAIRANDCDASTSFVLINTVADQGAVVSQLKDIAKSISCCTVCKYVTFSSEDIPELEGDMLVPSSNTSSKGPVRTCTNAACSCVSCVCSNCTCGGGGASKDEGGEATAAGGGSKNVTSSAVFLKSETANFVVEGMSCASCAARIETELRATDGIYSANVNFAASSACVTFEPSQMSVETLLSVISDLGYRPQVSIGVAGVAQARKALERAEELRYLLWESIFSGIFSLPLLVMMLIMWKLPDFDMAMHEMVYNRMTVNMLVQILLATPVVAVSGRHFFYRAFVSLRHFAFTMDTLITFGVGGAYLFSLIIFIVALADIDGMETYFDAAAVILFFMVLGKYLEARAKKGTSRALVLLMGLAGDTAILVTATGAEVEVPCSALGKGDIVRVSPGGHIPVDGIVESGCGAVDEQLITGESVPREKSVGDSVIGGTLCLTSDLLIRATRVGEETTLFRITKIVQEAQGTKPQIQRVADRIAGVFVPIVILFSIGVFIVWVAIGYAGVVPEDWMENRSPLFFAFSFFLATVVVACPCAVGLATPTAIMVGTGMGAVNGILIKGGPTLEQAMNVRCVLFDKTGTLTQGRIGVSDYIMVPLSEGDSASSEAAINDETIRAIVGTIEGRSKHPIGTAITNAFGVVMAEHYADLAVETRAGHGLRGTMTLLDPVVSLTILVGSPKHMETSGIAIPDYVQEYVTLWQSRGCTVVLAAINGHLRTVIATSDSPKAESLAVVKELRRRGIRVMMVTGDNKLAAKHIAAQVGIAPEDIFAEVLPEDKQNCVKQCQSDGMVVAFVGDGLNDSPALTQADVGVAIGAGTEVAIEAADAVLMHSNLRDLVTFFDLSTTTVRRIYFNFAWAVLYNVVALPFASGILFPAIRTQVPPTLAGGAMVLSSLSVLTSSLALKCFSPTEIKDVSAESPATGSDAAQGKDHRNTEPFVVA